MLPHLGRPTSTRALAIALEKVDAAATAEHAATLERARQVNAVLGLVGAPIVFMGLSGWAFYNWRRFGKDPVYLDDPSILMPAPPPDLTAASGRDAHGRRDVAARADDRDARPGLARADRVPRGAAGSWASAAEGGDRREPGARRRGARGAAAAQLAPSDRPGRRARAGPTPRPGRDADEAVITPEEMPKFGSARRCLRPRARDATSWARLVRPEAEQGRQPLGRSRHPGRRRWA